MVPILRISIYLYTPIYILIKSGSNLYCAVISYSIVRGDSVNSRRTAHISLHLLILKVEPVGGAWSQPVDRSLVVVLVHVEDLPVAVVVLHVGDAM